MDPNKIDLLGNINKKILQCRECTFHNELISRGLHYKPDAPCYPPGKLKDAQFKVISIGLNPGWNNQLSMERKNDYQDLYKMPISSDDEYSKYVQKINDLANKVPEGRQPYRDALSKILCMINDRMKIYDGVSNEIISTSLYDKYLFWANLSFCSSQKVYERSFWEAEKISCNVLSEEIPNCMDKGFLKEIMTCLEPELMIFFGSSHPLHPKVIVRKLSDVPYDKISFERDQFTAHKRNSTIEVKVDVSLCYSSEIGTKFLFLPHPNYRWGSEYQESALNWACSRLMNT